MNPSRLKHSIGLLAFCISLASVAPAQSDKSTTRDSFGRSVARFSIDHDRAALRSACNRALSAERSYALPRFYLGVLDEADENWSDAQKQFQLFIASEGQSVLSASARRELGKLPALMREDSTPSGKLNRRYRQHLEYASLLERKGFAKEALLETAEAAQLAPTRWEAYAIASSIMLAQHQTAHATHFLEIAEHYAPASAEGKLKPLATAIAQQSTHGTLP